MLDYDMLCAAFSRCKSDIEDLVAQGDRLPGNRTRKASRAISGLDSDWKANSAVACGHHAFRKWQSGGALGHDNLADVFQKLAH